MTLSFVFSTPISVRCVGSRKLATARRFFVLVFYMHAWLRILFFVNIILTHMMKRVELSRFLLLMPSRSAWYSIFGSTTVPGINVIVYNTSAAAVVRGENGCSRGGVYFFFVSCCCFGGGRSGRWKGGRVIACVEIDAVPVGTSR